MMTKDPQNAGGMPDTETPMDPQNAGGHPMDEGMEGEHDESMHGGVIHISSDMLPEGMAAKVNKGDIIEFKASGPMDEEGDIPLVYNTGKGDGEGDGMDEWENDFKKAMSPRNPEPMAGGGY